MAPSIYLTGHRSFANHGCEALVRSAVALFREAFGADEFLVPSADPREHAAFWPEAEAHGVRFVPAVETSPLHRWWDRAVRRVPGWRHLPWPPMPPDRATRDALDRAGMVVSTGGDNYSLDYGLVSLFSMIGVDGAAMARGLPTVLWGASVGPFEGAPHVVRPVGRHLARFDAVVARETVSHAYLRGMGLDGRLSLAADPAFLMQPQPVDVSGFWPTEGEGGTVAVNLSPIIRRTHAGGGTGATLEDEAAAFVTDLVARGYAVLLVPHVVGPSGSAAKCDHALLSGLLGKTGGSGGRIGLAPRTLNAPQLKFVLSRCRFALGGRTHCTIGALSSGVPTVSIAYSVKAKGINRDLFGDERHVLDGAALTRRTLAAAMDRLVAEEDDIRRTLAARRPDWRTSIDRALARLRQSLSARPTAAAGAIPAGAGR